MTQLGRALAPVNRLRRSLTPDDKANIVTFVCVAMVLATFFICMGAWVY